MANIIEELLDVLMVPSDKKIDLKKDYDPGFTGKWMKKEEAEKTLSEGIQILSEMQDKLWAQNQYAVLIILQALDAAGKDGTIKHVMSGVNPQGVDVHSFKVPSSEELDHDYLWRNFKALPSRGRIGIFNRSYYEEVLVVRVHPEFLANQQLPPDLKDEHIWSRRFEEINNFEKYLVENGIIVVKFFLYVSKDVQKERFLERTLMPEKNWKFSAADIKERAFWDDYIAAYEDMHSRPSALQVSTAFSVSVLQWSQILVMPFSFRAGIKFPGSVIVTPSTARSRPVGSSETVLKEPDSGLSERSMT